MTNINDFDPEISLVTDFKSSKDWSVLFNMSYCEENNVPHIVFNNTECCGIFSYLIFYERGKSKKMLDDCVKVIDGIKEELLSFIDEYEDDFFIVGRDFMRFKFKLIIIWYIIQNLMFQAV